MNKLKPEQDKLKGSIEPSEKPTLFDRLRVITDSINRQNLGRGIKESNEDRLASLMSEAIVEIHSAIQKLNQQVQHQNGTLFNTLIKAVSGFDGTSVGEQVFDIDTLMRVRREQQLADMLFMTFLTRHLDANKADYTLTQEGLTVEAQSYFKLREFAHNLACNINAKVQHPQAPDSPDLPEAVKVPEEPQKTSAPSVAENWGNCPASKAADLADEDAASAKRAAANAEEAVHKARRRMHAQDNQTNKITQGEVEVRGLTLNTLTALVDKARQQEHTKLMRQLQDEIGTLSGLAASQAIGVDPAQGVSLQARPNLKEGSLEGTLSFDKRDFPTLDSVMAGLFPPEQAKPAEDKEVKSSQLGSKDKPSNPDAV